MKKIILLFLMTFALFSIGHAQAVYDRSSIKCIGVELDGSQTLRVLGYGRNRADAKEQAMKNAVWAVIFDGIRDGVEGCNMKITLIFSLQIMVSIKKYVTLRDTKTRSANRKKDKVGYSYEMTIRVLRSQLKARLKADNVIGKEHL